MGIRLRDSAGKRWAGSAQRKDMERRFWAQMLSLFRKPRSRYCFSRNVSCSVYYFLLIANIEYLISRVSALVLFYRFGAQCAFRNSCYFGGYFYSFHFFLKCSWAVFTVSNLSQRYWKLLRKKLEKLLISFEVTHEWRMR